MVRPISGVSNNSQKHFMSFEAETFSHQFPFGLGGQDLWLSPTRPGFESRRGNMEQVLISRPCNWAFFFHGMVMFDITTEAVAADSFSDFLFCVDLMFDCSSSKIKFIFTSSCRPLILSLLRCIYTSIWLSSCIIYFLTHDLRGGRSFLISILKDF